MIAISTGYVFVFLAFNNNNWFRLFNF